MIKYKIIEVDNGFILKNNEDTMQTLITYERAEGITEKELNNSREEYSKAKDIMLENILQKISRNRKNHPDRKMKIQIEWDIVS